MTRFSLWLVVFVSMPVSGMVCACSHKALQSAEAASDARPAVRIASLICLQAAQDRDLDRLTSCLADDTVILSPGEPITRGKDAARQFWSSRLTNPGYHFRWQYESLEPGNAGEIAYETGACELDLAGLSGKVATTRGKFLIVWKQTRSRQWKIAAYSLSPD